MAFYYGAEDYGTSQFTLQDVAPSFGQKLGAAWQESWLESYGPTALDFAIPRVARMLGDDASPKLSGDEAKSVLDESGLKGLKITPTDGKYTRAQLDVLLDRQRTLQAAKDVRDRTPWDAGSVIRGGAMFAAGIVDPINLATAFVPWTRSVGALRGAAAAAETGATFAARTAGRAAIGAADAGISTAVLEPFNYAARNAVGDDYSAFDSMANIAFGTAFGGGLHVLGGGAAEALRKFRTGDALTPEARAKVEAARAAPDRAAAAEGLTPAEREALNIPSEAERAGMPEVTRAAETPEAPEVAPVRPRAMAARIVERNDGAYLMAESDAGSVGGVVDNGTLRINFAEVNEGQRGQGHGVALYERLVNEAIDRGLTVVSDETITNEAARVYAALERRGFKVTQTEGVGATEADEFSPTGGLFGPEGAPVFTVERGPDYQPPVETAADVAAQVHPETREALLRASVAQAVDGRNVDVDAIAGLDPNRNTTTPRDAQAAADRNMEPEQQAVADFDASEAVQARLDSAPRWSTVADAEAQMAEVDALLADTVKAGDDAYKYAREQGESRAAEVPKLEDVVAKGEAAGLDLFVSERKGVITLSKIVAAEREQGTGTAFMNELTAYADQTGQRIALTPSPDFGGNKKRLTEFYKRFGFVDNKGRARDPEISEAMYREPQVSKYARADVPLYAQGIPPEQAPAIIEQAVRESFGDSSAAMLDAGRIKIVATVDDLPPLPDGAKHPGDVTAATAPDGTVYVVAHNTAPAEMRGLMLHEVGVHVGMEKMLGPDVFQSVLRELDDAITRGESWATDARGAVPIDTPAHLVREEQLAYLVQASPELPLVQRILAAVRAWAYRTFEFARNNITLNDADLRAMAVSALHAVAREEGGAGAQGGVRYSRGELPEPAQPADELKPYDERIARAKQYPSVLRAAADKLESDAMAAEAMKAALPDITREEIAELLAGLRKEVSGLRSVTRDVRKALGAEDVVNDLQPDALRAADALANNLQMAAVIEKRNAALNMNARLKASTFLNQFRTAKLDFEGFRALLVGTERKRTGARLSIDAEQKGYRGAWIGGMVADMEKAGLMGAFASGQFDRDAYIALYRLGKKQDTAGLPPEAVKIAEIVNKYQEDARNTRNRFGAWIRDLNGYITRQTHDMMKIRDAGEAEFKRVVAPLLDLDKTLGGFQGSVDDFLSRVYDDFAAGSHMKAPTDETDVVAFGRGSNLAKKESASRVLYFKDGAAAYEYNARFGQGKLAESVLGGLDSAARSAGLLKILGTNPEATLTRLFDEYAESLRSDPKRRASFLSKRGEMENLLATVNGAANVPGNAQAAKISSGIRSLISMAKLGGMLISGFSDLPNYGAELRFGQGKNLLGGTLEGFGALLSGRSKGEKRDMLNALGVFHESTLGSVFARFDSPDLIGGKMAAAMQQFFKLSGINWWTESLRDGYAATHANFLASNARHEYKSLPSELRDMLSLYNIDAGKWEVLRQAPLSQADGRMYMTPEGLKTVPRATLETYIQSVGRTVSDASVQNLRDDLAQSLRTMTIDRMNHAVIEPNARARAFLLRGTKPGTATGELLRFVTQFKSFPTAMVQMALGREVYGRGYDTLTDYLKRGKGDMLGLASFIGLATAFGYASMATKDLLRGKNPRPVDDWRTWQAAMVQGGGLGIYGDFLFGKFSRTGGSLSSSLIGPTFGIVDTVADLWTRIRAGDDVAAASFNAALANTPFLNLFYTRTALDYLILFRIQESLNPGFLRRTEQRIQRDNGQTYFLPPSQNAL